MDNRRGFTVLELTVAVGVFSVVVAIAAGGLVRALRTMRQTTGFISANGNASLAIEQMSREIRTGYDFCKGGCKEGELVFLNAKKDSITYRKNGEVIERLCEAGSGERSGCEGDPGTYAITGEDVGVRYLSFGLFGGAPGDGYQPRVTIAVGVSGADAGIEGAVVNLETTVSSRLPLDS